MRAGGCRKPGDHEPARSLVRLDAVGVRHARRIVEAHTAWLDEVERVWADEQAYGVLLWTGA